MKAKIKFKDLSGWLKAIIVYVVVQAAATIIINLYMAVKY